MDIADILVNRFNNETEMKKNNNALICFSQLDTGKVLIRLATDLTRTKSEKSSITILYFIDRDEELRLSEDIDEYKHKIIAELMPEEMRDSVTLRLFIQSTQDYYRDILKTAEEQKSDLILLGINNEELHPELLKKYASLKNDPTCSETFILEQFENEEAEKLKGLNALFNQCSVPTGLFKDCGTKQFTNLFVPILQPTDTHLFTYLYKIALKENVKITIWDAIGLIEMDAKMQKLYQFISKKIEGSVCLWNNNKKIGSDFIREQDLIIIGTEGWNKLICTPLPWTDHLPSTLIIKETSNSIES